ncbi:hypothetical protein SK571_23875 [Lentzea sp. BCCO 10_0798]|uniref:Uncharacterized protein n=1 Tax=Lentzea kristufekii TaxID=3095430 RepID=A0ABU4TVW0_9PSEU|nr:hypothetical protein [Lentzea sp. BCCO 10_0798]MDX8052434.1 hypothetical protein [Lentzea sp. BCCO 10_0798]
MAEVTEFARRHQPLPECADVLIAFLADLVLERALLADDLVPPEKSSLQLKPTSVLVDHPAYLVAAFLEPRRLASVDR